MARSSRVVVVVAILIALGAVQLLRPAAADDTVLLSPTFHAASCPQLESIVRSAVQAALRKEIALAAGLLRIFFHDCFPQGCDASLLLVERDSEQEKGPNLTLQPRALQLIESIRAKVHAACGRTVSCTDITALATRDVVVVSGGPSFDVLQGKLDSLTSASADDVNSLPSPFTATAAALIASFRTRGLGDPADLVALSGGHTIGRAQCDFFSDRFNLTDPFSKRLARNCSSTPSPPLQNLDVITPDLFDNGYYKALVSKQGVFTSDVALTKDPRTARIVRQFAQSKQAFFAQFAKSMVKLSNAPRPAGNVGEIRRKCFSRNFPRVIETAAAAADEEGFAASAAGDEGFAASA